MTPENTSELMTPENTSELMTPENTSELTNPENTSELTNPENTSELMNPENTSDQLMIMAAFRYSLTRQSYIVHTCVQWLKDNWHKCSLATKKRILQDIAEELMRGHVPDNITWRLFGIWIMDNIDAEIVLEVKSSVTWTMELWPL